MDYCECSSVGCGNSVFSRGLCRKHYEQERLETAPPCSFLGCTVSAYRSGMCAVHYRQHIKNLRPACIVPGCTGKQKTLKSGYCDKHLFRASRHGTIVQPRPLDWGAREKHPNYQIWVWHRRKGVAGFFKDWHDDFWAFVEAVGDRPAKHTLRRNDPTQPLGPGNWDWVESLDSKDKAAYQRNWRQANPEKATSHNLKKMYGITLEQYEEIAVQQNGVCAICKNPEQALDKDGAPRRMPVDHCHKTGKVRALLCTACNRALGLFKDNPEVLRSAAQYVEKHLDSPQNT